MLCGNSFELWLDGKWNELFGYNSSNIIDIQNRTRRLITAQDYGLDAMLVETGGQPLANYILSLQFVDTAGYRRGPWSFMSENQWRQHQRLVEEDCDRRFVPSLGVFGC